MKIPESEDKGLLESFLKDELDLRRSISWMRNYYWWKKTQTIDNFFKREMAKNAGRSIKVIELGCGQGPNIFRLYHEWGEKVDLHLYGVDLLPKNIKYCEIKKTLYKAKNVYFSIGNAEKIDLPESSFDILFCLEVIEHLINPKRALKEFYRILKPEGLAIITTPNKNNLVSKLGKFLFKAKSNPLKNEELVNLSYPDSEPKKAGYDHISVKSLGEWEKLFQDCGFRIENIGQSSILAGCPGQEKYRVIFAFFLLLEVLLDQLPLRQSLFEDIIVSIRKSNL